MQGLHVSEHSKACVLSVNVRLSQVGALQDANSLAHYNVGPETMLSLAVRERGGRRK